jgi:hypothetical protein
MRFFGWLFQHRRPAHTLILSYYGPACTAGSKAHGHQELVSSFTAIDLNFRHTLIDRTEHNVYFQICSDLPQAYDPNDSKNRTSHQDPPSSRPKHRGKATEELTYGQPPELELSNSIATFGWSGLESFCGQRRRHISPLLLVTLVHSLLTLLRRS